MELDVPMVGSSHVVLGWKFPNFHADALFLPGQEEASWDTCMELLLRACEGPEPPEWLLWEWADGRASLQHSGFPMASPSPFYYTHHYPHLFSGLCVVLGWPQGPYYSLSQIGSQVPNSSL